MSNFSVFEWAVLALLFLIWWRLGGIAESAKKRTEKIEDIHLWLKVDDSTSKINQIADNLESIRSMVIKMEHLAARIKKRDFSSEPDLFTEMYSHIKTSPEDEPS